MGKFKSVVQSMKYIAFSDNSVAIFSPTITHHDIPSPFGAHPISAGFMTFDDDGNIVCYGSSGSMGLDSRGEEDANLISEEFVYRHKDTSAIKEDTLVDVRMIDYGGFKGENDINFSLLPSEEDMQ